MSATETRSIFPSGMPLMDAVTGPDNNNLENGRLKKKKKREKIHGGATLDEVIYPDKFVALSNPVTR